MAAGFTTGISCFVYRSGFCERPVKLLKQGVQDAQRGGLGVGGGEIKGEKEEDSKHSIRLSDTVSEKLYALRSLGFTQTHWLFQEGGSCFG